MMRLDAEMTTDINTEEEERFIENFKSYAAIEKPHIVILEDYNKGLLTEKVIHQLIGICKENGILVSVDPKRKNFFAYKNVDLFKPNLKEAKEALNIIADGVSSKMLEEIHFALHQQLHHKISFITLSEKGVYFQSDESHSWIPTHIRSIADVSGAGDTVIAVASLVYASTHDTKLMAEMANIAGGLVCEEVGTVAINKKRLMEECKRLM
jgi:rfaE bifunctional protein kinase chain/domain